MAKKPNSQRVAPKGDVRFSITLSDEQKLAKGEVLNHAFSFLLGKAGSGKTLLATQIALDQFFKRGIDKIVITRPTVTTEDNGFLPGTEAEKMEPWLVPIRDNMRKVYDKLEILQKLEENRDIELVSLSHFRGRTFDNCICIVDEFQNLTKNQLRMVLSRLGKDSKMILCGDREQIDLRNTNDSAIHDVAKLRGSKWVFEVNLLDNHRHEALTDILKLLSE